VYPQGEKDIYRVTAQDGASTLASGDHLWAVATRDDRRRGKPLRVLQTRDMIGNLRANHYHRYELPMHSAPVCFPYREVPMDPYALGRLLGDGCLTGATTPSFATADPELAWELQRRLPGTEVRPLQR
jgi:phosphate starvation-inducible PhoH-like protein